MANLDPKYEMAAFARQKYGIPLSIADDDAIDYFHYKEPAMATEVMKSLLAKKDQQGKDEFAAQNPGTAMVNKASEGIQAVQAQVGNAVAPLIESAGKALNPAGLPMGGVPYGAQMETAAAPIVKAGQTVMEKSAESANLLAENLGPAGAALGTALYTANAANPLIPKSTADVLMAPMLMAGGNAGGKAGALAEGKTGKTVAAYASGLTGVPMNDVKAALADVTMFHRAEALKAAAGTETSAEAAGNAMNEFADKLGVKSGSDATKGIPAVSRKAAPTLNTGDSFVDAVHNGLGKMDELDYLRKVRADAVARGTSNVTKTADEYANAVNAGAQEHLGGPLTHAEQLQAGTRGPHMVNKSPAEGLVDDLDKMIAKLEKPVEEGGAPTVQDLVAARQNLSKKVQLPKYLSDAEKLDVKLTTENLNSIDDALESRTASAGISVDVPGYGKVSDWGTLRRIYREAMVTDKMSSSFPVNKNGTPSALRMMHIVGGGVGAAAGHAVAGNVGAALGSVGGTVAAGALESPAAWKAGMKGALALTGQAKVSDEMARAMVAGALGFKAATGPQDEPQTPPEAKRPDPYHNAKDLPKIRPSKKSMPESDSQSN